MYKNTTKNQKVVRLNKNNNSFQFDKYFIIDYIYYVKNQCCVRINIADILFDIELWKFVGICIYKFNKY